MPPFNPALDAGVMPLFIDDSPHGLASVPQTPIVCADRNTRKLPALSIRAPLIQTHDRRLCRPNGSSPYDPQCRTTPHSRAARVRLNESSLVPRSACAA
jgi:hypothetical protein